jgi:hypothetical protein
LRTKGTPLSPEVDRSGSCPKLDKVLAVLDREGHRLAIDRSGSDTSHFKTKKDESLLRDEENTTSPCSSLQWLRDDQRFELIAEWDRAIATALRGPIADEVNHNNVPRRAARVR